MKFLSKPLYRPFYLISIALLILFSSIGISIHNTMAAPTEADILVDVNSGSDTSDCGTEGQPCASIQYAVNAADSGQTIRVAAGTYTYNAAADSCSSVIGMTAVVCFGNKQLTLLGGFTGSNWYEANPETNITIIDGQNNERGFLVHQGEADPSYSLTMDGFTIQNGYATASNFAYGGGLYAGNHTTINLTRMIFKNNRAVGANTATDQGGTASGGGLALISANLVTLNDVKFDGNQAIGGSGVNWGGFGQGGGIFTSRSTLTGNNVTLVGNLAQGGSSNGNATENADAQGGGAAFHRDSVITLTNISVTDNQAIGGDTPNGSAGGAFGGGLYAEAAERVEITDALIQNNVAQGGDGKNPAKGGSLSFGGGIGTTNSTLILERAWVIGNQSLGGDGDGFTGSGNGGGASLVRTTGNSFINIDNSVFANNNAFMGSGTILGGGGGGIYVRGIDATISHTTIAQNQIGSFMQGEAMVLLVSASSPSIINLQHSIIAQHTTISNAYALHIQPGNTLNLHQGLFDNNNNNTNNEGTITGLATMIEGNSRFISPGTPHFDYHISPDSDAVNMATDSSITDDIDTDSRDGSPDIGADEYHPPTITHLNGYSTSVNTVQVTWIPSHMVDLDYYELVITCPPGGGSPDGYACNSPINTGSNTSIEFTGLTNFMKYNANVTAYDASGGVIAVKSADFTPTDIFVYLPNIQR